MRTNFFRRDKVFRALIFLLQLTFASWHGWCYVSGMVSKHVITMHKPWPHTGSFGLHLHEIAAKLRKAVTFEIPTGYQDETGFHMGVKPAEKDIKWPSVW